MRLAQVVCIELSGEVTMAVAHLMDAPDHHEATPILKIFIPVQGGNDALFPLE